jgi:hypothetical protein
MKYRKKPIVIDAMRFDGDNYNAVFAWIDEQDDPPPVSTDAEHGGIAIETLEGVMVANKGDWIIRGVKGEIYPCKPDIFEMTYEAVD